MEIVQIQKRISKLLALSGSSNPNEAKLSLLKARELMAKYKLQLPEEGSNPVVYSEIGISFTWLSEPWIPYLCRTIATNYCCHIILYHEKGKKINEIQLVGLRNDFDVCKTALQYAVECVRNGVEKNKTAADARMRREMGKAYGMGFAEGLHEAIEEQNQKNRSQWGLVMQPSKEVCEYIDSLDTETKVSNISISSGTADAKSRGQKDGKQFGSRKRLGKE